MAYNPLTTVSPGDIVASAWAAKVKGNFEASAPHVFTAAGDLYVGSGVQAGDHLPAGTNGTKLVADNTQTLGMRWGGLKHRTTTVPTTALITDEILIITGTTTGTPKITLYSAAGYTTEGHELMVINATSGPGFHIEIVDSDGTTNLLWLNRSQGGVRLLAINSAWRILASNVNHATDGHSHDNSTYTNQGAPITNAGIAAAAAIASSKVAGFNASTGHAHTGAANDGPPIANAGIASAAAIAYSKLALTGALLNADISASAAIAFNKIAPGTAASGNWTLQGHLLFTDNTYDIGASGATRPRTGYFAATVSAVTSVVAGSGSNQTTIGAKVLDFYNVASSDALIRLVDDSTTVNVIAFTKSSGVAYATMLNGGLVMGAATGGNKGVGTINVSSNIYLNNAAYTNPDYALEHFFTGKIVKFKDNPGAAEYKGLMSLQDIERYTRQNFRLPGITDEPAGVVERHDFALRYIEELFLHAINHERRLEIVESRLAALNV